MPLYAFIYILYIFSFLSLIITHLLIILSLVILYLIAYLLQKVSYIYFTYHTRAGVRVVGAFWGVLGRFWRSYPLFGRLMDGRRAFGAACVRDRACFSVRAGVRGYAPPFFARAQPQRVYPLIVYGGYIGESCV